MLAVPVLRDALLRWMQWSAGEMAWRELQVLLVPVLDALLWGWGLQRREYCGGGMGQYGTHGTGTCGVSTH